MWQRYMVIASAILPLCGFGCDERHEVVARERTAAGSTSGDGDVEGDGDGDVEGDGDGDGGGGAGAPLGGSAGIQAPRLASPSPVLELNDPVAKDQDPTVTGDHLEIFFFSDRGGNADIWRATRGDTSNPWTSPVVVSELNSAETEQNPAISRDGLRIWFYSRRDPLGIYYAERTSRTEPFGEPQALGIRHGNDPDGFAIAPSVDALELRMAVSIGAATSRDLYEVVRASLTGSWGEATLLLGVNSTNADSTPFLIDDGKEMLFHSGRAGAGDLFWAYRESPGLPFTQVEPLTEVNDPASFESHPHLTADRQWLYFGSNRDGNTDIYVAEVIEE